ncbi:MAG: type II toxin-antitoxin system RelE/ParE family toxin [Deltaproteobacteria bacterium]|jgi:toxin ParE1/3/4|nr:type II toxin-antitoxin system RelE/ParE family toxin [Deltaproteobacteria bacterium]
MSKGKEKPRTWRVEILLEADKDITDIVNFIYNREGSAMAREILKRFRTAKENLQTFPERGRITPELRRINILEYRELQIPPYRMIYQISEPESTVYIHVVVDGRRDMAELLQARLLKPDMPDEDSFRQ